MRTSQRSVNGQRPCELGFVPPIALDLAVPEPRGEKSKVESAVVGRRLCSAVMGRMPNRLGTVDGRIVIELPGTLQPESARPCRQAYVFKIEEEA